MKEYTRPELEITEFELEDVLTVSNGGTIAPKGNESGWY